MSYKIRFLERGRFHVTDTRGTKRQHLVDVCAYDGSGGCSCEAFLIRKIRPCKHMQALYEYLGMEVAAEIYQKYMDGNEVSQI